jgi:drug/metabolite transporter (DMT)-like permease
VLTILCFPLLALINFSELNEHFWLNSFLAAVLDMAGTLFLVMSLSKTDLSVFGPLNAYKVVISMILAMLFLGEIPSLQGLFGIFIILIASYFLFPINNKVSTNRLLTLFLEKGVQYRFLSILLFSIGTLPLKNAVMSGGALATTVFWCLFGFPLAALVHHIFLKDKLSSDITKSKQFFHQFLYLGIAIFLMQYMTMIILSQFMVAYSLALFQLNMVLQVFLGYRIFKEQHIKQRLAACSVMIIGSLLVIQA